MPRNPEIDRLKTALDQAFQTKQVAHDRMKSIGQRRRDLHDRLADSWSEVCSAREEMNSAYETQQSNWEAYRRERSAISAQIDDVARDADRAHEAMKDAFERASNAYEYGDRSEAPHYAGEGRSYRDERDSYNAEKKRLIDIAKAMTPPYSDFHHYRDRYSSLMESHKSLQSEYQPVKQHHEAAKDEFNIAKASYESVRADFDKAIATERAKWRDASCQECGATIRINTEWAHPPRYCKECKEKLQTQQAIKMAEHEKQSRNVETAVMLSNSSTWGVFDGKRAKIVPRKDGTGKVDVFYGGLDLDGDGYGHGHIVIQDDQIIYLRTPWKDKRNPDEVAINDDGDINHTKI